MNTRGISEEYTQIIHRGLWVAKAAGLFLVRYRSLRGSLPFSIPASEYAALKGEQFA